MYSEVDTGWVTGRLSPELRLLIDCCRANFTRGRYKRGECDHGTVDWQHFRALAHRHRVEGLAWHGLRALGLEPREDIAVSLLTATRQIAEHGLRAAFESERIRAHFSSQSIPLLFLKGLAVGQLAYGDPFRKTSSDLDLLVAKEDVGRAAYRLRALGYRPVGPACSDDKAIERWHSVSKESIWINHEDALHLELHSALTDHQSLIAGVGVDSPQQQVNIMQGISLATLANDEQIAYLCVHGASSAWFRLKWISDLAGLLAGSSEAELARLLDRARALGAARSANQALLLACFLFPILPVDAALSRALRRDHMAMWLARRSLAQLLASEPTTRFLGTLTIHFTQLLLAPGWRSGCSEFRRQLALRAQNKRFRTLV